MSQADFERAWMHGNFIYNPRFYYIREKSMWNLNPSLINGRN
jgi:hypothetical protein